MFEVRFDSPHLPTKFAKRLICGEDMFLQPFLAGMAALLWHINHTETVSPGDHSGWRQSASPDGMPSVKNGD
jgi:hypothetical protein